jgi:hypothetical protein
LEEITIAAKTAQYQEAAIFKDPLNGQYSNLTGGI